LVQVKARPVLVSGNANDYLKDNQELASFFLLPVLVLQIFNIPYSPVIHWHPDLWAHRNSPTRQIAREWLGKRTSVKN